MPSLPPPASTVKEYFQILEDTLIGGFIWPYHRNERKKARPKFYFFDCGLVRALHQRLNDPPTPSEKGFLFETWFIQELLRLRDYGFKAHDFSHWRKRQHEIDFLVEKGGRVLAGIECKSGKKEISRTTVVAFREDFPGVPLIVASALDSRPRIVDGVEILPWRNALEWYSALPG